MSENLIGALSNYLNSNLCGRSLLAALSEDMNEYMLFDSEFTLNPIIYQCLLSFLDQNNIPLSVDLPNGFMLKLAHMLYHVSNLDMFLRLI